MTAGANSESAWWQSAVIYEIALISFQDSDGDGKGDLAGLMSRIGYLKWLGVKAVWLTPIYRSPFRDLGYDISDYCSIELAFGRLDGFDELLAALHEADIRLILDLVPITPPMTMNGSSRVALRPTMRRPTGISGPTLPRMAVHRTTG
jgi:alpha-glucosidase